MTVAWRFHQTPGPAARIVGLQCGFRFVYLFWRGRLPLFPAVTCGESFANQSSCDSFRSSVFVLSIVHKLSDRGKRSYDVKDHRFAKDYTADGMAVAQFDFRCRTSPGIRMKPRMLLWPCA